MLSSGTTKSMEVLISQQLELGDSVSLTVYDAEDAKWASDVLTALGRSWEIQTLRPECDYLRSGPCAERMYQYVNRSLSDPLWRGSSLEFDR